MKKRLDHALPGFILAAALCLAPGARAEDMSPGMMLPALESVWGQSVAAKEINLTLGDAKDHRAVKLEMRLSGEGQALTSHFPPFGWFGEGVMTYPARQFPELRATLDGAPVAIVSRPFVLYDGADITAQVRAARLDPFVVSSSEMPWVDPNPAPTAKAAFTRLQKLGALTTTARLRQFGIVFSEPSPSQWALWSVGRNIKIPLGHGAQEGRTLGLTYTALPAFAITSMDMLEGDFPLARYCLTPEALRHKLTGLEDNGYVLVEGFAIPVGIGRVPAEKLRVTLSPWTPDSVMHFFSGPNMLRIFCGADRQPVITGHEGISHDAATGLDGTAYILIIASMSSSL
ncbi:MAG: hypothetical protein FWD67_11840 [Betaproteobacteria bacterium]|nr:hypothetical protein [Betaproteobacteria bacterium]